MPAFCLRHDVDALLWQPRPEQPDALWEHIATFNALGESHHEHSISSFSYSCVSAAWFKCLEG